MLDRRLILGGLLGGSWSWSAMAARMVVPVAASTSANPEFVQSLLALLADDAGIDWQLQFVPWARAISMAERGESLVFGVSRNAQREAIYEFSDVVYENHVWLVMRRDQQFAVDRLEDLQGRRVCLRRGVSYGDAFDAAKGRLFQVELSDGSLGQRARMLVNGRCDVTVSSSRGKSAWLVEQRLREESGLRAAIAVHPRPLGAEGIHFAAARAHGLSAAIERINRALRLRRPAFLELVTREA